MRVAARFAPWVPSALPSVRARLTVLHAVVPTTPRPRLLWSLGSVGGLFGGLLGIGGGSAIAPLLLLVGALRPAQVSGTTLASVLFISSVGSVAYGSLGHLNIGIALPIALGSVLGSVIGALTARRLSMRLMLGLFLFLLPYFAIKAGITHIKLPGPK